MDRAHLLERLKEERIRTDAFDLDGRALSETYILGPSPEGWETFYSERGQKVERRIFASEDEACHFFLDWVSSDPITRER